MEKIDKIRLLGFTTLQATYEGHDARDVATLYTRFRDAWAAPLTQMQIKARCAAMMIRSYKLLINLN
jgi:hypothetical protein